jgi:hypothetical protein
VGVVGVGFRISTGPPSNETRTCSTPAACTAVGAGSSANGRGGGVADADHDAVDRQRRPVVEGRGPGAEAPRVDLELLAAGRAPARADGVQRVGAVQALEHEGRDAVGDVGGGDPHAALVEIVGVRGPERRARVHAVVDLLAGEVLGGQEPAAERRRRLAVEGQGEGAGGAVHADAGDELDDGRARELGLGGVEAEADRRRVVGDGGGGGEGEGEGRERDGGEVAEGAEGDRHGGVSCGWRLVARSPHEQRPCQGASSGITRVWPGGGGEIRRCPRARGRLSPGTGRRSEIRPTRPGHVFGAARPERARTLSSLATGGRQGEG